MPLGFGWRLVRRTRLFWFTGPMILAIVAGAAIYLSRPTVLVGRHWARSDQVACGGISHQPWDELLRRFVDAEGNVDYSTWKESVGDLRRLDDYVSSLSRLDESRFATLPQRLAFWINAYNAVTVLGILREYPTTSVQNHVSRVGGYNFWRDLRLIVGEQNYSLGEIEHTLLRPLNEPRIHFAIVCASRGCPRVRNEAYTAERLEEQLQSNAIAFFADPTKCAVTTAGNELQLSPILKWYADDFGTSLPAVLQRITPWLPDDARSMAQGKNVRVVYLDYDWNLNDQLAAAPPLPPPE
jgi:hypothetical protein